MNIKIKIAVWGSAMAPLAFPFITSAQADALDTDWFTDALATLGNFLDLLVPFLVGLAVVLFLWGVLTYVMAGADDEKKKNARNFMIWGIIAIFVMVSVWGIIEILTNLFGTNVVTPPPTPQLPT